MASPAIRQVFFLTLSVFPGLKNNIPFSYATKGVVGTPVPG